MAYQMKLLLPLLLIVACGAGSALSGKAEVEVCITGTAVGGLHRMACGSAEDIGKLETIVTADAGGERD